MMRGGLVAFVLAQSFCGGFPSNVPPIGERALFSFVWSGIRPYNMKQHPNRMSLCTMRRRPAENYAGCSTALRSSMHDSHNNPLEVPGGDRKPKKARVDELLVAEGLAVDTKVRYDKSNICDNTLSVMLFYFIIPSQCACIRI
jgi:hypothetical protein